MQKQNDKLKYDKFGFVDLTEEVKINDRGYLIFLLGLIGTCLLIGLCQPASAISFISPRDTVKGSISGDGDELLRTITDKGKRDSLSAGGLGRPIPAVGSEAGGVRFLDPRATNPTGNQSGTNQQTNRLNQPTVELEAHPEAKSEPINYDKLFHAVSMAESGGCTSPVAKRTNNCTSIMVWDSAGKRHIKKFASIEENKKAFIALWRSKYKTLPTLRHAICYTNGCNSNGERAGIWLNTVNQHYHD